MNYLNYLPEDIYTVIYEYIHPAEIINLCLARNIKTTVPLDILGFYFDDLERNCDECDITTYDYIKGWQTYDVLCCKCIKRCSYCRTYIRLDPKHKYMYGYVTNPASYKGYGMYDGPRYIPGMKHNCNRKRGEYLCGDCLIYDHGNRYKCERCKK